jgi:hypothetical protein
VADKFDLGKYVEVKDRIAILYELYPQARLVTGEVRLSTEPDGKPRVLVQAFAYRSPDDEHPGIGWSWMELPGNTPYTKGSELENTETSAWGRAIASLGILVDRSIASAQEVQNKQTEAQPTHADGLQGTAEMGKGDADFSLRQTPTGARLAFRLVQGRTGFKVIATDALAESLALIRPGVEGQSVTVWGTFHDETFRPKGKDQDVTYQVIHLERIATADLILPAPSDVAPGQEELPL